jgi:signal transduction histidine kinase
MSPLTRSLFSAMTLALILMYGTSLPPNPLAWGGLIALASVYLAMIWSSFAWWTAARYALAACLVISLAGILLLSHLGGIDLLGDLLLIPLILFLGREQGEQRWIALVLAILAMAAMFALAKGALYIWTVLPVVAALYMSVRAINIYKQAYQLSQQNVEALRAAHRELQETHAALQEATVYSMRYAALAERTRMAREIHDGLGHQLTSLIVQLQALEIMLPGDPQRASQGVPMLLAAARSAMAEVRRAIETWREDESSLGLAALQGLVSQYADVAPFTLKFQPEGEFSQWPEELSVALYRILQEALTNITRHAQASTACIQLREAGDEVVVTVSDDGIYTEDKPLTPGYGLRGIEERSQGLGGTCSLSQNVPHGLKLQVSLPIAPLAVRTVAP